jgi:hypothetical protein
MSTLTKILGWIFILHVIAIVLMSWMLMKGERAMIARAAHAGSGSVVQNAYIPEP